MTVAHDSVSKDHLAKIRSLLQSIQTKPSIRIVKFKTQAGKNRLYAIPSPICTRRLTPHPMVLDLHQFQEAVTGFRVLYDG
jgi:hypothetical protein